MQPDPDLPDVGMRCSSALILSGTPATAWQYPHADKRYTTWEDPSFPMYSPDGHALPSPMGASLGVTAEDLRPLGLWPEHRDILERMQAVVLRIRPGLTPRTCYGSAGASPAEQPLPPQHPASKARPRSRELRDTPSALAGRRRRPRAGCCGDHDTSLR